MRNDPSVAGEIDKPAALGGGQSGPRLGLALIGLASEQEVGSRSLCQFTKRRPRPVGIDFPAVR